LGLSRVSSGDRTFRAMAEHSHPPISPARDQRRTAMAASLVVAVLMLVGKLTAFHITGSTAILSDAVESVIHLFATGIAAFGLWYAAQPADAGHPYGHGKIAYFSSAFEGVLILFAAVAIIVLAIADLITGPEVQQLGIGLAITGGLAAVNAVLGASLVYVGRKHNALVLIANGQHVLTDMWTSVGVVAGVALVWVTGIVWLDPVVALLVGMNILRTAGGLVARSYDGLMEKADAEETGNIADVLEAARTTGKVSGWHQLRHRRVNDQVWVEMHLLFPPSLSITEAHHRATSVEAAVRDLFPRDRVSITSHLEPETHEHPSGFHEPARDALRPPYA
jgi:cation diffusion facilitator family transporter